MPQGRSRVPRLRPDAAKNKIKINNKSFLKKEIVIVLCIWGVSSYIIRLIYHEILNCCNEIGALTVLSHCPVGLLQTTAMPQNRLLLDAQTFTQTHEHTQPATRLQEQRTRNYLNRACLHLMKWNRRTATVHYRT